MTMQVPIPKKLTKEQILNARMTWLHQMRCKLFYGLTVTDFTGHRQRHTSLKKFKDNNQDEKLDVVLIPESYDPIWRQFVYEKDFIFDPRKIAF
jgi:hypothetical protein